MNTIADSHEALASVTVIPSLQSLRLLFTALAATALLSACGGGGGAASAAAPAASAPAPGVAELSGLWVDTNAAQSGNAGTLRYLLVDASGEFWGIPSITFGTSGASASPLEAENGVISVSAGNVSGSFYDINMKTCGLLYLCKVSGLLTSNQLTIAGAKVLSGTSLPDFSFSGIRDPSSAVQAVVSSVAGTWDTRASLSSSLNASGSTVVGANGAVTVNNIGGCAFAGQLTPVQGKGYYKLALATVNGSCSAGVVPAQIDGVAYTVKDSTGRTYLNLMWHNADFSQYFWGTGAGALL